MEDGRQGHGTRAGTWWGGFHVQTRPPVGRWRLPALRLGPPALPAGRDGGDATGAAARRRGGGGPLPQPVAVMVVATLPASGGGGGRAGLQERILSIAGGGLAHLVDPVHYVTVVSLWAVSCIACCRRLCMESHPQSHPSLLR